MMNAREASARNSLVGSRIGKFDVIAEIGTGGMASVYLARSAGAGGFHRLVAIKVMHPHLSQEDSFVEMFLDEARVAATIHHPNVVSIIDVGIENGLIFLVMEYVEGDSFSNVEKMAVSLRRRIPLGITLRVVLDALSGLHCAHELTDHLGNPLRIIHRDVSPQNVVVGVDGSARIVDFGIAKAESRITTTQVGLIKGKLNFMAPEQIRGAPLDRRVDIFGMGVTLWEAITLRRLFAGENEFDTARKILSGEYPSLRDYDPKLPPVLDAICRRALHPDPDQRYGTAAEFAEAIEAELHAHIAAAREVSGFIAGVAAQKLDRERRAVRDAAALAASHANDEDDDLDEPSFMTSTLVETPPGTAAPAHNAVSGVLPSTAVPRAKPEDAATVKNSRFRAPTMSMPTRANAPARGAASGDEEEVGGTTRSLRHPAPANAAAPAAGAHGAYDDEGATAPFQSAEVMQQVKAARPIAPVAPAPAPAPAPQAGHDQDDDEDIGEARTVFQPVQLPSAPASALATAPSPPFQRPPPPAERSAPIDLVQRRPGPDASAQHPALPQPDPFAPPPQAPPGMTPYGYNPGAPAHMTQQLPAQPAPRGVPAIVYVLASLVLVGAAAAVLWYVLHSAQ